MLAPVYVVPVSGKAVQVGDELKNTVSLVGDADLLMRRLVEVAGQRLAVVALGNPYSAADYPGISNSCITFSDLSGVGDGRGEGAVWRDPDSRTPPVTTPGVARARRGN